VRIALAIAPILYFLSRALFPIIVPLEALTRWFVRRSEASGVPTVTEGEIREMTAIGHREGEIDEHERKIIERAFRLDTTRAWDIMTPRVEIFAWPASRRLDEIARISRRCASPAFRSTGTRSTTSRACSTSGTPTRRSSRGSAGHPG
jgi:putative hemolysin